MDVLKRMNDAIDYIEQNLDKKSELQRGRKHRSIFGSSF